MCSSQSPVSRHLRLVAKTLLFIVMNVIVNNKTVELPDASGINALLAQLNIASPQGIAIAVNEQVVPKSEWQSCVLKDNDAVLLIRATQGG